MVATGINIFSPRQPITAARLQDIVGKVDCDGGWFRSPTRFDFSTLAGPARLTVAGEAYWVEQRDGLKNYAASFISAGPSLIAFHGLIDTFRTVYALHCATDVVAGDPTYVLIEKIAGAVDGVVFGWGSIIVPGRGPLFGPMTKPVGPFPSATEEQLKGIVRTSHDAPDPTAAQLARRERNIAHITCLNLPVLPSLPVIEDASEVSVREVAEVAERMLCIAVCAVKAEKEDRDFIGGLIERYGIATRLSPEECDFLAETGSTAQQRAKFSWRYECLHVLLWYLGFQSEISSPGKPCDVKRAIGFLRDHTFEQIVDAALPRSRDELLDQADLQYRLHWAGVHLRLKRQESPVLMEGLVKERHYALNWLIRYHDADWDDVPTDT